MCTTFTFAAPEFDTLLTTAHQYRDDNKPKLAQKYYERALNKAANDEQTKAALFGQGKMLLWREKYMSARDVFERLLKFSLNNTEHEYTLAHLMIAMNNLDYPKEAYALLPRNFVITEPLMAIAAAQSTSWAGWIYKTQDIMQTSQKVLNKIPVKSYLKNIVQELDWDIKRGMAHNSAYYRYYHERDTDNFKFDRNTFGVQHKFNDTSRSEFNYTRGYYRLQPDVEHTDTFTLAHSADLTPYFSTNLAASLARINNHDLFLWNVFFGYGRDNHVFMAISNNQNFVESIPSIQDRITVNTTDVTLVLHPFAKSFFNISLFHQDFSDHNMRNGVFFRFVQVLFNDIGINGEVTSRLYENSLPTTPYYFSPKSFREISFLLNFRRKLSPTARIYAFGGFGQQTIKSDATTPSSASLVQVFETGFEELILRDFEFKIYYGYSSIPTITGFARNYFAAQLSWFGAPRNN